MPAAWLALPAFAKINLSLEFLGRRADGYTELRTVYQTVSLHDRLRLRLAGVHGRVVVRVPGGDAPEGRRNIIHRLLGRARRRLGLRAGIEVELEKQIPSARGLGGGSSDAAAALAGLLRLTRKRLALPQAMALGAEAGADVPFFLLGGRALGVGRGEEVYALEDAERLTCVLLCPPRPIATAHAYRWAARRLTLLRRAARMNASQFLSDAPWGARNDFEPVLFRRFPELARMKADLLGAGAQRAGLSGSG
ncbi:MAG: 4-(cytidine 5'-diphospho)-2-C-methyl-D-erythritol kinase, partial [Terriglobia bacterium]